MKTFIELVRTISVIQIQVLICLNADLFNPVRAEVHKVGIYISD